MGPLFVFKGGRMDLTQTKEVLQKACDEMALQLVSVRYYHDGELEITHKVLNPESNRDLQEIKNKTK